MMASQQQQISLRDDFKIPAIGLGTFTITVENELETALDTALKTGYRHIDTAFFYTNETLIGKVLKKWFDSGKLKREDLFITTKLPGCEPPEKVNFYLKESLAALQIDYVDLYLIHVPIALLVLDKKNPISTSVAVPSNYLSTWKAMEEQVDNGLTKYIGISNFNLAQVKTILDNCRIVPAVNQVELHIYLQQFELVKFCQDNGIIIESYQTFGNPGISAWYAKNYPKRAAMQNYSNILSDLTVKKIAEKYGKTIAQVLLKFFIQKNIPVIPKSVTPIRIKENFDIFDFILDEDDIRNLEKLDKGEMGRATKMDQHESWVKHSDYPF